MSSTVAGRLTFKEFERLPDPPDGGRYELLEGELVLAPPAKLDHSDIRDALFDWLNARLSADWKRRIEFACVLGDRSYLIADLGVTSRLRWLAARGESYFSGAPELAVEIISPSNSAAEIDEKTSLFFRYGAQEFWTVNQRRKSVTVHSVDQPRRVYAGSDRVLLTRFGIDEPLPLSAIFS
ncbi:MAG: Uma2 family endonuclease [Bryobacteraceae bacterium]|nr:Uma2 family endonuclease [Bryobacteraceae bacterium]